MSDSWAAAIVNHGSYDDLEACIAALHGQSMPPDAICIYDTLVDPVALDRVALQFPSLQIESGENIGFAAGANRALESLTRAAPSATYALLLNPDVVLEPDFAHALIVKTSERPKAVIATGKLLRPGGKKIDSAGITIPRHRRPRDRGSEDVDRGQFDS